jgi:ABC-type antimicrobial peptide transport system permease subunit
VFDVQSMRERLRGTFAASRFNARLLGVLGGVGLLLSIVGVYGVVSYHAGRRVQEIGLRMALGASATEVQALVTRQGLAPVFAGLVLGAAGALAATRLLRGSLFGVTSTDPLAFAATAGILLATSAVAAYLPARRASRVDPGRVLAS